MTEIPNTPEWSDNISLITKTTLDLPPSCLEFIPKPSEDTDASPHLRDHYHEYFVVGTYCLEKDEDSSVPPPEDDEEQISEPLKPQSKNGSLVLFRYHDDTLQIIQTLLHPSAVFDLHFLPCSPIFAIVSSSGDVSIFRIISPSPSSQETGPGLTMQLISTHQAFTSGISPTFFAWAPNSQHTMAVTTSDGVFLVSFNSSYSDFTVLNNSQAVIEHTEYAWCCAFTPTPSGTRLYSGGDDNKLRLEDLGSVLKTLDPEEEIEPSGLWTKGLGGHEAGVTFILPIPVPTFGEDGDWVEKEGEGEEEAEEEAKEEEEKEEDKEEEKEKEKEQFLLTGSYDDHVRVYSIPAYPSRPSILTSLHLGGGVWRLKFMDKPSTTDRSVEYTVLASCMHAGARILSLEGRKEKENGEWKWEIKVLAEMSLHKSMNYASDVQDVRGHGGARNKERICVSSSFYDTLLCVWGWRPDGVKDGSVYR